ncbi:MAG: hypothetical protein CME25_11320 [Gemmatimonadetes bacterium]|nr:hypothetical protein [Gemmatimonadota bacterium]
MRHFYRALLVVCLSSSAFAGEPPVDMYTPARDSLFVLERFDSYAKAVGEFPKNWEGRTGWRQKRTKRPEDLYYKIEVEDGDYFLRAQTIGKATNVGRDARVNLRVYNLVRWRWRVHSLPLGADESDAEKNDSGASVRLVFKGRWPVPKTLKYVWSTTLPKGTETVSPSSDRTRVVVLESGPDLAGKWVWEEVNAYEDYRRLFGGEPRLVEAIAVITDSDNTLSPVKADYDDFLFLIAAPDSTVNTGTEGDQETDQ